MFKNVGHVLANSVPTTAAGWEAKRALRRKERRSSERRSPTCGRPGLGCRTGTRSSADGGDLWPAGGGGATMEPEGPMEPPGRGDLCNRGRVAAESGSDRLEGTRKCWRSRSSRY